MEDKRNNLKKIKLNHLWKWLLLSLDLLGVLALLKILVSEKTIIIWISI